MDTALVLRKKYDSGYYFSAEEIVELQRNSELLKLLTESFIEKSMFAIWRVIALSEIPYSKNSKYTQDLVAYIERYLGTANGFTLSGKETDLLPCYNGMLIEAFSKLGLSDSQYVKAGIEWIMKYQPFNRDSKSCWEGKGVLKYGGCLKKVPCFIGIVKSLKALVAYSYTINNNNNNNKEINQLIDESMKYVLKHELYKRLSTEEPINSHILDLSFPQSYQLNIVELLELAYMTGNIEDKACESGLNYILTKQKKNGSWSINHIYKGEGYLSFDKRGTDGEWLT